MCKLFEGIPSAKIDELFAHLAVREVKLKKGEMLFKSGSRITDFAVIVSGRLAISSYDAAGHRGICAAMAPEALKAALSETERVSVAI